MNLRAAAFGVLVAVAVAYGAAEAWQARGGFLRRNGIHHALQNDPENAMRQLERALKADPSDAQARLWKARLILASGDTTASRAVLSERPFPTGSDSSRDAATLLQTLDYLADLRATPPARSLRQTKRIGGPEAAVATARAARELLATGDLPGAAEGLANAVNIGDTNSETRLLAVLALAAQGEYSIAQGILETLAADVRARANRALAQWEENSTGSFSVADAVASARRKASLSDVALWLRVQAVASAPDAPAAITADSQLTARLAAARIQLTETDASATTSSRAREPISPAAMLLTSQLFELNGEPRMAYLATESLARQATSLSYALRLAQLRGDKPTLAMLREAVAVAATTSTVIGASEMSLSGAETRGDEVAWYREGTATTTITLTESSRRRVALVARGDKAAGVSPRLRISINGQQTQTLAITTDSYDVYPVMLSLQPGSNTLAISFVNNVTPPTATNEDRNAYLLALVMEEPSSAASGNDNP